MVKGDFDSSASSNEFWAEKQRALSKNVIYVKKGTLKSKFANFMILGTKSVPD